MRHYGTSCGPMSCVPKRKYAYKNSSSTPYIAMQWGSDTNSEITSVVISLMVSLYHCTTIYGFDDEFWYASFFVSTHDIGPHEVS